jgi:hypothetical protein
MMGLNDRELVTALTSVFLPIIIAIVQRPAWSDRRRAIVAFGLILLWTLGGVIYLGEGVPQSVDWHAWLRLLLVNALTAYTVYQNLYKATGVAQRIEAATSPKGSPEEMWAAAEKRAEGHARTRPPASDAT